MRPSSVPGHEEYPVSIPRYADPVADIAPEGLPAGDVPLREVLGQKVSPLGSEGDLPEVCFRPYIQITVLAVGHLQDLDQGAQNILSSPRLGPPVRGGTPFIPAEGV